MNTQRLLRRLVIVCAVGLAGNVFGVALSSAFQERPVVRDFFGGVFITGTGVLSIGSAGVALLSLMTTMRPSFVSKALAAVSGAVTGVVLWYVGLYWPFALFSEAY